MHPPNGDPRSHGRASSRRTLAPAYWVGLRWPRSAPHKDLPCFLMANRRRRPIGPKKNGRGGLGEGTCRNMGGTARPIVEIDSGEQGTTFSVPMVGPTGVPTAMDR